MDRPYQDGSAAVACVEEGGRKGETFDEAAAEEMVAKLRSKFRSGETRNLAWREQQLRNLARMAEEHEDDIMAALKADLGRGRMEVLIEVLGVWKAASHMLKNFKKWAKPHKVGTPLSLKPGRSEVVYEPLGLVLIISPWNFPFLLSLEPLVGALATGNVVVLKPSEHAPASSHLLSRLLPLYLDSQAVQVVEGGPETGKALLGRRWDKIFFTGGTALGRIVMEAASRHLTPVTLELGGKNPLFIDDSADLEISAKRIISGKCTNAGQVCLVPDYILATKDVAARLIPHLKAAIEQFYGTDPSRCADLARIINHSHVRRLQHLVEHAATAACVVHGGESDVESKYFAPTLLLNVPWDAPIMQTEVFGPILTIQTVSGIDEAIDMITARPKPLVVMVFSSREAVRQRFLKETSSGAMVANEIILQAANLELPFGGVGESGMGRYKGRFSFDCFSHCKAAFTKPLGRDLALRFPPSTRRGEMILKAVFRGAYFSLLLLLLGLKKH
ncbi:hypothetical protein CLOM_g5123 [Closterium sp. NIES-68]|nr:hypothetical protein CLOM_g5123 [Closterium sp. NIES-68]GJP79632.1 hypothetical protein CLOP_g9841 [Closterium sp. NIES-67]